ncbi:MAG TPA: ATP-binding protein, partial [Anaerolineales bacterium]|nr:ATP-binding protein [Anaerolineales bacterium]
VEQSVYRVAQEALTNAARHADAKTLRVTLRHDTNCLTLTVADDGSGFDPTQVNDARYGLKGLHERAEMIGGTLEVDSQPQKGTTVKLSILT